MNEIGELKEKAREHFTNLGLTYEVLTPYTIDLLINYIQGEILALREENPDCFLRRMKPYKYTAKQIKTNKFDCVELLVDGTYFHNREAVTFNSDGFIGFAGWASGYVNLPFINGFVKWCDKLANRVGEVNGCKKTIR